MDNHYFGTGDRPAEVHSVHYGRCDEGHNLIIYVAGVTYHGQKIRQHAGGGCPACAAMMAARFERQEAVGT